MRYLPILVAATALSACNLAPDHVRPVGAIPATLPQGGAYPALSPDAADVTAIAWRDFFVDPRLRSVIEAGLANNRDLRLAAANVLQARAQYRVQRTFLLPAITANGGATFTNNPFGFGGGAPGAGAGGVGAGGAGAGGAAGATSSDIEIYQANIGTSAFEIDLFGRLRNQSRAALEQYFATEEAQRAARISLIGEIANAWLTMAADQESLQLARRTQTSFAESLRLTQAQFRIGVSSELEVRQAETNFQAARNDIATLTARIAQDQNAINLLAGTTVPTEQLPAGLGTGDATLSDLPANLSSDVLLRRPDVLQSERQLAAQAANIGAARAALFPTISLTATLGTISTALSGLFGANSDTYNVAPNVSVPIFAFGRGQANIRATRAAQQGAVATYERTLQVAFREVADALATRGTMAEQLAARTARAEAARVAARLSDARYRAGVDSFLTSLDAQRTAYAAEQDLVATRAARATNLVTLYRTLGGGLN
ncbi:MAG TPA: efflux transporter outer membrane subunit [Sphingomonas sp.]|jgi:multidrug efflux system outer membrane protein